MKEAKFNDNWLFWKDTDAFALVWNVPEIAKDVTLPHDAMIESDADPQSLNKGNTGFRNGGVYTYVKKLWVSETDCDKVLMLKFEGVYMNAAVYVNGQLAANRPYGYSVFYVCLNEYLKYGEENEIRVLVRNSAMANSRWYSGGGIYRDVYFLESGLTYIAPEETTIVTETVEEDYAVLRIASEIRNKHYQNKQLRLVVSVTDAFGKEVAVDEQRVFAPANAVKSLTQRIVVRNAKCWSAEQPMLYHCISKLYEGDTLLDESVECFGIRTLQLDTINGLRVNGQTVKLRGACIHHDSGLLGAATYSDAQYRQIRMLKEAGFNAVRMAHNPMAPAMLRACDELGMYVMDESFDMWTRSKSDYDYGLFFNEWWEKDIESMVKKDRNHPCVLMYSLGNEIPEIGTCAGTLICEKLLRKVRELDNTRYTLASINGIFAAGDAMDKIVADITASTENQTEGVNVNSFMAIMGSSIDRIVQHEEVSKRLELACAGFDIAGYNYMPERYEADGERYPNRVIVGSESNPPDLASNWKKVMKLPHVIGDFTWTGWDYIGEAGIGIPAYHWGEGGFGANYPCQLAYCGDFDITGFRRPISYYREIAFGLRSEPYIAVQDPAHYGQPVLKTPWILSDSAASWNWDVEEGSKAVVEVFAKGDEVVLYLNGNEVGRKKPDELPGYYTTFEVPYKLGTLTAVAYENGEEIGRYSLHSAGASRIVTLEKEQESGSELIYIPIEIRDEENQLAMDESGELGVFVEGAEILGFGSGNPRPLANYNASVTNMYHGRALLILKRNDAEIAVRIKACYEKSMSTEKSI